MSDGYVEIRCTECDTVVRFTSGGGTFSHEHQTWQVEMKGGDASDEDR